MSVQDIPEEIRRRFRLFCQLVEENQYRPRLPDGYVVNGVYTGLDDVPCDSYEHDYRWGIKLRPGAKFTTAMIFFNDELVFAWCAGKVYIDRIPEEFILNFETELGAKYRQSEPDLEEVNPDPIDLGVAYCESPAQTPEGVWVQEGRRIADEIMSTF